jgi:hypothetical protein
MAHDRPAMGAAVMSGSWYQGDIVQGAGHWIVRTPSGDYTITNEVFLNIADEPLRIAARLRYEWSSSGKHCPTYGNSGVPLHYHVPPAGSDQPHTGIDKLQYRRPAAVVRSASTSTPQDPSLYMVKVWLQGGTGTKLANTQYDLGTRYLTDGYDGPGWYVQHPNRPGLRRVHEGSRAGGHYIID